MNSYYKDIVTNQKVTSNFSVLVYFLSVLGSEWKYDDKIKKLKEFLQKILEVLDKNIYKILGDLYKLIQTKHIQEEILNKEFYDLIIKFLYCIYSFKLRKNQ